MTFKDRVKIWWYQDANAHQMGVMIAITIMVAFLAGAMCGCRMLSPTWPF